MQKRMRENQLTLKQMEKLLNKQQIGHFATVNEDGRPYVTPMHYAYLNGKIYMHGLPLGQKLDNLKKNPCVGFEVQKCGKFKLAKNPKTACNVNTEYESVIITGTAEVIQDFDIKEAALWAIVKKYVPELETLPMPANAIKGVAVIEITIEAMTGKFYKEKEKKDDEH